MSHTAAAKPATPRIEAFQICYTAESAQSVPAGFKALNNLDNARADWREYWPIREYLLNNTLEDGVLYGFVSPKFSYKTGLDYQAVQSFVEKQYQGEDMVFFSPFWDLGSFFTNVFEQGDFFHDGIQAACKEFVTHLGWNPALIDTVMHSRNTVFCNYFFGTKSFWMRWLHLGEQLFHAAEHGDPNSTLYQLLNDNCRYGEERIPRKIFVMERLASLILLADPSVRSCAYDPFRLPPSATPLHQHFYEAVSCDALKQAWMQSASPAYIATFLQIRNKVLGMDQAASSSTQAAALPLAKQA